MATAFAPARPLSIGKNKSRLWWHVHQWVGFKLSLLLGFIFLTGTLAVLSSEIDWVLNPSLRVDPATVGASPDWARIAVNASNHPSVANVNNIGEPTASAFAARVSVEYHDGTLGYLHAHPATGAIQGQSGFVDANRILRNMHRHLNMPGWIGIPIVTSLSFLLLVSFITSMVVYKKWWRGFWRWPRKRDARAWWGDLHRLAGVWSLWFVALISVTGVWYFIEELGGNAAQGPKAEIAAYQGTPTQIGTQFARSLAAARAADPHLDIANIRFPTEKSGTFIFEGQKSAILVRHRANAVTTDVATGKALLVTDATNLDVHQRISEMADPLHFGYFGGYWTKTIWSLFGALLTSLAVSGVVIYGLRIGKQLRVNPRTGDAYSIAWHGMGIWRWVALALIIAAFVLLPELFAQRAN